MKRQNFVYVPFFAFIVKNLKALILVFAIIILGICHVMASPAYPGLINFVQPDGSKIKIYLRGDERVKWAETEDGYSILFNDKGAYEYAVLDSQGDMVPSGKMAKIAAQRSNDDLTFLLNVPKHLRYSSSQVGMSKQIGNMMLKGGNLWKSFPTTGDRKLLCILIGFTDKPFVKTQEDFDNLFNQATYTVNGAIGSVNKFFYESSYGQLNLKAIVKGPYIASNTVAHYGANKETGSDLYPSELVTEAVNLANNDVNYGDFDNDGDGTVDGVYVIYAGYGEEWGGSPDYINAHSWYIPTVVLDGMNINRYACSSELTGVSGSDIREIGASCHEFGHLLGARDYFDTDYEKNGHYVGTGYWDLQGWGAWNNAGRTPAQPNAYTKCYVYNWATATVLTDPGSPITIQNSSAQKTGSFYRMNTTTDNEYFLFENRQQVGFDGALPGHGMLVYHVDGAFIAANSDDSTINDGSHQGMYIMAANSPEANGVSILAESTINTSGCTFSAANGKTSFTDETIPSSQSWASANTSKPLTNITENNIDKTVSFSFMGGISCSPPTTQALNFQATDITESEMNVSWSRGNGDFVMVVARALAPVDNEPFIGTYYTPNPVFGSSNAELGTGNYVVYNGDASSVKVTGLGSGIRYYFSIYEYDSSGTCYKTPALTGSALTPGYRVSTGNVEYGTRITAVIFNTINQTSIEPKTSGYTDFTAVKTAVEINSTYLLTVKVNTDGDWLNSAYVWIDWNHNSNFDDPGETYNMGTAQNVTDGPTSASPYSITVPDYAVNGPTRMRLSNKYYDPPTAYETDFDGEVEDYTIVVTSPVTWTGNIDTNTDWHTDNNWDPVGVPTAYHNVTVTNLKNDPRIVSSSLCYDLTLEIGSKLTIGTTGSLTVNGNLTKDAVTTGLVLESASSGTGSLKILGSVTGSATVERYFTPDVWHLISSPTSSQSIINFLNDNKDIAITLLTPEPVFYRFAMRDYNPSGTAGHEWNPYFTSSSADLFSTGKGYIVGTQAPFTQTVKFEGALNTLPIGNLTVTSGWNLIGNPFTSAINVNSLASNTSGGTNFLTANSSVLTGSYAAIYVWDETQSTTDYQVVNNSSDATYAPIGQGFFVKGIGSVSFTSDMQVHKGSEILKIATVHYPEIKLIATNQNKSVSTTIKFIESTTPGLDIGYDAGLFKSNDSLAIFTKLVEDNGVKFQLQCLPTNQYSSLVIPVGIESISGGEIVLSVETVQLDPNCKIILEDRLTNTFIDLSKDAYKTAIAANTVVADRFFLHTGDIISGLDDKELSGKLTAYAVRNVEIRVIGEVTDDAVATLYNGLGKVVLIQKLGAGNLNIIGLPNLSSGVYMLNINDNGMSQTIKVMVRK